MVWNKYLYLEAGLDPEQGPTSLASFKEQALAVAGLDKEGVAGTYFGGNCGGCIVFTWFPFLWGNGEEVISADGTTSLLNTDSWKAVLDTFAELEAAGAVGVGSKEETGATWTAAFNAGKVGVMPFPAGVVQAAVDAGVDIGVAGIPGIDGGQSTFLGGDALGISKDSEHVDQAWNFLAWTTTEEAQLGYAKAGFTPGRNSLSDNEFSRGDPLVLAANATVKDGRTPVAPFFAEAFNAAGSPFITQVRHAVFEGMDTVDADNDAITAILAQ
jgi:multiple sugar transport system substrate-binding protein